MKKYMTLEERITKLEKRICEAAGRDFKVGDVIDVNAIEYMVSSILSQCDSEWLAIKTEDHKVSTYGSDVESRLLVVSICLSYRDIGSTKKWTKTLASLCVPYSEDGIIEDEYRARCINVNDKSEYNKWFSSVKTAIKAMPAVVNRWLERFNSRNDIEFTR